MPETIASSTEELRSAAEYGIQLYLSIGRKQSSHKQLQ